MNKDRITNQKGFFAIEKTRFHDACELGMNAAIAYLVICNGTDRTNSKSSWSVYAIERYTGISRGRAKSAVETLIENKIIKRLKSGKHPRYQVMHRKKEKQLNAEKVIWLPSGIVQSVEGENAPIDRIRQTHDMMILQLFVDLYSVQNLVDDGGIPKSIISKKYEREKISEHGIYDIYGFRSTNLSMRWGTEVTSVHRIHNLTGKQKEQGLNEAYLFFERFELLISLGLVQIIPHMVDNDTDEGEILYSLNSEVSSKAYQASERMVAEFHLPRFEEFDFIVPVPRHYRKAAVVGIAQLRYKPRTKLTAMGYEITKKQDDTALLEFIEI